MSFGCANRVLSRFSKQSLHKTYQPRRCFSYSARLADQQQQQPQHDPSTSRTTHFGFENVPESEKAFRVGKVFTSVAPSYDTMNDLMSLGIHRLWKDYFVRSLNPGVSPSSSNAPPPSTTTDHPTPSPSPSPPDLSSSSSMTILDVASGTGDIALRLLSHCSTIHNDHKTRVIISDINPEMLAAGRKRIQTSSPPTNFAGRISYLEADAHRFESIPDGSIDLYTVAFGIRNFTDVPRALETALRVLKPGGVFACLEFAPKLGNAVLNGLYKRWSFGAIPLIGQLVAGDRDSYQYLVESIERFPDQARFRGMIEEAGFLVPGGKQQGGGWMEDGGREKGWVDLTGGVAAIHKGVKPLHRR